MKNLLLSLVGVIGTTSTAFVPAVMSKNHQNINYIETKEDEKKYEEFELKLNTDYGKQPISGKHNHTEEFTHFFSHIRKTISDNKIQDWKITEITAKVDRKTIPGIAGEVPIGYADEERMEALNSVLHAKTIEKIDMKAEFDGPYVGSTWQWFLAGKAVVDSKSYSLTGMDGFKRNEDYLPYEDGGIKDGVYIKIKIEYNTSQAIDISIGNYSKETTINMEYFKTTLSDFQKQMAVNTAVDLLKKADHTVDASWLSFKKAIWMEKERDVTEELTQGKLGFGKYHLDVTVGINEDGHKNGFMGEISFIMILDFPCYDLSKVNDNKIDNLHVDSYKVLLDNIKSRIIDMLVEKIGISSEFISKDLIDLNLTLFDSKTNKRFSSDDWDSMSSSESKTIYAFILPKDKGKQQGVISSARIFINFIATKTE